MTHSHRKTSKFMSLLLRHNPGAAGLVLDDAGWVEIDALLGALNANGHATTRAELQELVESNDKRRFAFDDDGARIRAVQGHSVEVALGYVPSAPPGQLFHGTVPRFLEAITAEGLVAGDRNHVHLSPDIETARTVGSRRGKPVILTIDAAAMHGDAHEFYLADNGVWLTERVPVKYIISWS